MMTKSTVVAAIVFSLAIGAGTAFAQNPPPAADQAAAGAMDKKAISKACSDQANAKNLHGKERKKFRADANTKAARWNSRSRQRDRSAAVTEVDPGLPRPRQVRNP